MVVATALMCRFPNRLNMRYHAGTAALRLRRYFFVLGRDRAISNERGRRREKNENIKINQSGVPHTHYAHTNEIRTISVRTSVGIQMLVDMQKWMPNESIHVLKMRPKQLCLYMARALWVVRTKYEWIKWFICWNGFFSSSHSSPLCFAHSEVLWNDILSGVNESVTCVARKYNLATKTHTRTCQSPGKNMTFSPYKPATLP